MIAFLPTRCSWPAYSERVFGRSCSARGACVIFILYTPRKGEAMPAVYDFVVNSKTYVFVF